MLRYFIFVVFACLSTSPAWTQCSRAAGSPIDMQVHLSFEDQISQEDSTLNIAGLPSSSHQTGGGNSGQEHGEFDSHMQIRVQLQDSFGSNLGETSPNSEGKIVFRVCSKVSYRMRVFGPTIEETQLDNLVPGQGDKIMSVALHHKRIQDRSHKDSSTVSASRLKIPRHARKELEKGNRALAEGKLPDAQKHFEKAISLYPQFDQAYNNLGVVLMQSGRSQEGKAAFEKAIAINDHFARAYVNLAKIALDAKDFTKAHQFAQTALTSEPLNPGALFVGTEAAYFSGYTTEAIAYTRKLHSLPHPNLGLAHFLSAKALQSQDLGGQAMTEYEYFLQEDPRDPNVPAARQMLLQLQSRSASSRP